MLETEVHQLLKRHAEIENRRARVEGALLSCKEEEAAIQAECLKLGVDPAQLDSEIARLEEQIRAEMERVGDNLCRIDGLLRSIHY